MVAPDKNLFLIVLQATVPKEEQDGNWKNRTTKGLLSSGPFKSYNFNNAFKNTFRI